MKTKLKKLTLKISSNILYSILLTILYFALFQIGFIENFDLTHQVFTSIFSLLLLGGIYIYALIDVCKYVYKGMRSNPILPWC